ncbi:MAG: RluA family pseudouridine synthase [Clostridiales bacterium]|nr:RluA family pseudouridine synthase [Clostridiales bacterium]
MQIITYKHIGAQKPLVKLLTGKEFGISYAAAMRLLRNKDIRINGARVKSADTLINDGDEVSAYYAPPVRNIETVFEDDNIIVADKPAGIETEGAGDTLETALKARYGEALPVHRLDRNTRGLVVFARNQGAYAAMTAAFKDGLVEKGYYARVIGSVKQSEAELTAYLSKDSQKSRVYISDTPLAGAVKIRTGYTVLERGGGTTLLDVRLHTGKTHQIRAHLAHIGHPIAGDGKYGTNAQNAGLPYKTQQLTAYSLKFAFSAQSPLAYLNGKAFEIN